MKAERHLPNANASKWTNYSNKIDNITYQQHSRPKKMPRPASYSDSERGMCHQPPPLGNIKNNKLAGRLTRTYLRGCRNTRSLFTIAPGDMLFEVPTCLQPSLLLHFFRIKIILWLLRPLTTKPGRTSLSLPVLQCHNEIDAESFLLCFLPVRPPWLPHKKPNSAENPGPMKSTRMPHCHPFQRGCSKWNIWVTCSSNQINEQMTGVASSQLLHHKQYFLC